MYLMFSPVLFMAANPGPDRNDPDWVVTLYTTYPDYASPAQTGLHHLDLERSDIQYQARTGNMS